MIKHLHDREKALEQFGLKGREAEWIALVCLHSGVFMRSQFCHFFALENRQRATRFVRDLVERELAVEYPLPNKRGGAKAIRVSYRPVYRALGIENVKHRRQADDIGMLRRLLSLDYVLENQELPWLPTEQEKVTFFDLLGIDRRRLPKRVYQGAVGKQLRYFALKLPIAANAKSATFGYVDPGKDTDTELRSWGDSHEWLWRALRLKGIEVHVVVIGADHKVTIRAEAALKTWSSRGGEQSSQRADGPCRNDPDVQAEIKLIEDAIINVDMRIIRKYGSVEAISDRLMELKDLPKRSGSVGVTIDGFETWVSDRVRAEETV